MRYPGHPVQLFSVSLSLSLSLSLSFRMTDDLSLSVCLSVCLSLSLSLSLFLSRVVGGSKILPVPGFSKDEVIVVNEMQSTV